MVNNSVNINKTNNHEAIEYKKNRTQGFGNPGHDLGQAHKCGWVTLVNGIQPPPYDNWISNDNTCINKQ